MLIVDREGTAEEAKKLGLKDGEFDLIVGHLGRKPSFTELAMFSGMWSEHCSYKNSILLLKKLYSESDRLLAKPGEENAGSLKINDKQAVVFKVESHNHPSAVEPYQGAATGVGGIMRDVFTMGARPIATLNSLRFGMPAKDQRTRYLLRRVVKGIGDYGNSLGIANTGGEIFFHESYTRNPLVNAMTVGVADIDKMATAKIPGPGKWVVYVGAKTGRDGIHGASFASKNLSKESEEERSAVQVGDPFLEKLVMEATIECIQKKLVLAIQDMGAAGLVSSSSEMAASGNVGVRLDLEKVPARETGMVPFEFMLSESQERMLMVIEPGNWDKVKAVFDKWELDAAVIGETTEGKNLQIFMDGKCYADLTAEILTKKAPRYEREQKPVAMKQGAADLNQLDELLQKADISGVTKLFAKLLAHPNLCSRQPIYRQYDTDIGLKRVIGPGQNGCVVRVPHSDSALAVTIDGNGYYIAIDPYKGAQHTVAEAVRNIAATGAVPIGLTNCLNFANPYIPENYWFFAQAVTGMSDACREFKVPIVSGNVSFYNESEDGPVLPTPTMGVVGLLEKAVHAVPAAPADLSSKLNLFLCGKFAPSQQASQYHYAEGKPLGGPLPSLDLKTELAGAQKLAKLAGAGVLAAAIDLSAGGLMRAACRVAFACFESSGKMPSITLDITVLGKGLADTLLLGETAHCYLVAVSDANASALEKEHSAEFPVAKLGSFEAGGGKLKLGQTEIALADLYAAWAGGLKEYFR
ncbi:phosphoribosylformylglycinamidine synthase subunit PurL [Turneriella parva]|uniref:Phosphoribosylformylglycinamidine synthase subunit PurL n=1 Tax=Turneriella parva (strain ATCC BAA-1111 / DSM 21527 / NCTC 11395 / H) TaxID=869212 RepID=I4B0L1_TURPD|nr:phosphoribosylformylglycinamidine synthase subunit PurL [Turneriella parva]AFM10818.1 Phosphoribosylformylglycinamidine synthase 2 [Turneriella parva DSM 21527]